MFFFSCIIIRLLNSLEELEELSTEPIFSSTKNERNSSFLDRNLADIFFKFVRALSVYLFRSLQFCPLNVK